MGSGEVEGTSLPIRTVGLGWQWALCRISPHYWGLDPPSRRTRGRLEKLGMWLGTSVLLAVGSSWFGVAGDDFLFLLLGFDPNCTF